MITVSGCGGDGGGGATPEGEQIVRGKGFVFSAPADWTQTVSPVGASVMPTKGSETIVAVTVFRLLRPFRPALWPQAAAELDRVADRLAGQLGGEVDDKRTIRPGLTQYELAYERGGAPFRQRIRFVLRGRREFELLCRWKVDSGEPPACDRALESFRPS